MKVLELAKKLRIPVQELILFLKDVDVKVKSPTSKLDDKTVSTVKELWADNRAEKAEKAAAEKAEKDQNNEQKEVQLNEPTITVAKLAQLLDLKLAQVMKIFLQKGLLVNLNSEIDSETAILIAKEADINLKFEKKEKNDQKIKNHLTKIEEAELEDNLDELEARPPLVTIMGHVDHGKTLLLDAIRQTNVVAKEAGGITQHIGAYQVKIKKRKITFLDTPGHEAFTALRLRGAQVTDIAILVVAADEGIKPQTVEALNHAKAAKIPIIVAINKIDRPEANIDQCKQQLAQYDLLAEDWGGKTVMVPVSAKTKVGIDDLLEMILIVADMLELKANKKCPAQGIIIESRLSKQKGPVATLLVKTGTLKTGDCFIIGTKIGKVRALFNDLGKPIKSAEPGMPVEILGIDGVPEPGEMLKVYISEKAAREAAEKKLSVAKASKKLSSVSLETLSKQIEEGDIKNLNLIIKADVNGSLDAIIASIKQIPAEEVNINILHAATGGINENDIMLAKASQALVLGFGIKASLPAQKIAEEENITIKTYKIIYKIIEDVEKVVKGMFKIEYEIVEIGKAEIRQLFHYSKVGQIAGSYITEGKLIRNFMVKILRDGKEIGETKIDSLKRFKEDIREVANGFECGVVLEKSDILKEGDIIVCLEKRQKNIL
ncbi:translation initiation factor IF-2 [bacterium]|nr:translation initiation factor IF-2 [bacterium]MBT3582093.1 translation initiation factor IF-2 [bacterium]MBT4552173.1 translation initiation factor IF-2 [bacterium]MBT5989026.1 translation initiation factor IF-2 [bacterium]MBT7087814.1 translation initiation factor IF-2 [bacterium]